MDAVWSIILTVVCVAIGLLSERKKKTHTVKTAATTSRTPATSRFKPTAEQQPKPTIRVNLPLPREGEHITLPAPTADDLEAMRRKKLRNQALNRHYSFWRRAVAAQTILNRNHSL